MILIKNTKNVLCHNFFPVCILCTVLIAKRSDVFEVPFSENRLFFTELFPDFFFLSAGMRKAKYETAYPIPD